LTIKPVVLHIALASYMLLIFIVSSVPGDDISKMDLDVSDKLIHGVVYLILLILFFCSLKYQSKSVKLRNNALMYAGLFSALYGMTDELHQYFVPMRSCELLDWIADVAGIAVGMLLIKLTWRRQLINMFLLLLIFAFASCDSSKGVKPDSPKGFEVLIISEECWVDHMPVIDNLGPKLGFQIGLKLTGDLSNVKVKEVQISRGSGEYVSKPFEMTVQDSSGSEMKINVIQARDTKYFEEELKEDETVQFKVILGNGKTASRILETTKIKPYKVY
jgi:VanZ family protein